MAPDSIDIMYGFAMLEGVEISVTTAHSLGDELSANVESCFGRSVLGGVGKKLQTCHSMKNDLIWATVTSMVCSSADMVPKCRFWNIKIC